MTTTFRVTHPDELPKAVDPSVEQVAGQVADQAASNSPVSTGRLRDGWRTERGDDGEYRVVNDVPYARFVEYGTRYIRPHSMVGKAAADARSRYGG